METDLTKLFDNENISLISEELVQTNVNSTFDMRSHDSYYT